MAVTFSRSKTLIFNRVFSTFSLIVYFAFILLSTFIFLAPKADAATIYDEAYQTTGALYAKHPTCLARSVHAGTLTWLSWNNKMTNTQKDMFEQASRNYTVMSQGYGTSGSSNSDDTAFARIVFSYNASSSYFSWTYSAPQQKGRVLLRPTDGEHIIAEIRQRSITHDDSCELYISQFGRGSGGHLISQEPPDDYTYFVRNYVALGDVDFNYPDGYMGREVVGNFSEVIPVAYPHVEYEINDRTITLSYQRNMPYDGPDECQDIQYKFYDSSGTEVNWQYNDLEEDPIDKEFTYEFSDYGHKSVTVEWNNLNNDGCPIVDFIERAISEIHFELDGNFHTGDNYSGDNCDLTGLCRPVSDIEDCSVYNPITDMGEFIVCWAGNIVTVWKSWFTSLFIPKQSFLDNSFNELQEYAEENASIISYPAVWYTSITSSMIAQGPDCTLNVSGFYNASATWDLCDMENKFPTVWNLAVTLTRFMLVMMLFFTLYMFYIKTWNHS